MKKSMLLMVGLVALQGCATFEKKIRREAADGAVAFIESKRPMYVDMLCDNASLAFETLKKEVRSAIEK